MEFLRRIGRWGQDDPRSGASAPLQAGTRAPDFSLRSTMGESLSLDSLRGHPVVLVFYPADNSHVCSNQLALYNEAFPLFEEHDAQLLAISTDDLTSHQTFATQLNLRYPLLADDEPPGAISQRYGVYDARRGVSQRALFVLDGDGIIRWSHVVPDYINPGADGILRTLEQLA